MNLITKTYFSLFCTAAFIATMGQLQAQGEIECNIIFPANYSSQGIKIYQAGEIVHTKMDDHILSFFVKDHKREHTIYFIIIRPANITYKFKPEIDKTKQQTIESINIKPGSDYKTYKVSITKNKDLTVSEISLDTTTIPDTSVLILYNPAYIQTMMISENKTLVFHVIENLLEVGNGKDALFAEEVIYLFDTLHSDPLHQKSSYRVVIGNPKCKQVIHV